MNRHRYVPPLKHKEYHLLKVKVTHRNMRKLAAIYKEFKWRNIFGWYKNCKMRFRYSTRYRKHPNSSMWRSKTYNMKNGKYIYMMTTTYSYNNQRSPHAKLLLIKHINKENEQLIRYSVQNFYKESNRKDYPF